MSQKRKMFDNNQFSLLPSMKGFFKLLLIVGLFAWSSVSYGQFYLQSGKECSGESATYQIILGPGQTVTSWEVLPASAGIVITDDPSGNDSRKSVAWDFTNEETFTLRANLRNSDLTTTTYDRLVERPEITPYANQDAILEADVNTEYLYNFTADLGAGYYIKWKLTAPEPLSTVTEINTDPDIKSLQLSASDFETSGIYILEAIPHTSCDETNENYNITLSIDYSAPPCDPVLATGINVPATIPAGTNITDISAQIASGIDPSTISSIIWYTVPESNISGTEESPIFNFPTGGNYDVSAVLVGDSDCETIVTQSIVAVSQEQSGMLILRHSQLLPNPSVNYNIKALESDDCSLRRTVTATDVYFDFHLDRGFGTEEFGTEYSTNVSLAYSVVDVYANVLQTETVNLVLETDKRTHLYKLSIDDVENATNVLLDITYSGDATVSDNVELSIYTKEIDEYNISDVSPLVQQLFQQDNSKWEQELIWENAGCDLIPNYEVQVLRIYQNDNENIDNDDVAWDRALSIVTENNSTSLKLILAEGDNDLWDESTEQWVNNGVDYIWRVRPIGSLEGGINNPNNWGPWSTSDQPRTIDYSQPDKDKNWIYSKFYSEGNKKKEQLVFADDLQNEVIRQIKMEEQDQIISTQTITDYSGRPALTTLPTPQNTGDLGFNGQVLIGFGKDQFDKAVIGAPDSENKVYNATPVVVDYYDGSNYIADAQGFPYTRTVFENDNTGRVKEKAGVGYTHSLTNGKTVKTKYVGVEDGDLVKLFGPETPLAHNVHKVITYDANNVGSVSYQDKSGKTLATALIRNTVSSLDEISTGDSESVYSENTQAYKTSPLSFITISPVYFQAPQTGFQLNYELTPSTYSLSEFGLDAGLLDCAVDLCQSCEYTVTLRVKDEEFNVLYEDKNIPWQTFTCGDADPNSPLNASFDINKEGKYTFEAVVSALPRQETVGGYYDQKEALSSALNVAIDNALAPLMVHINNNDAKSLALALDNNYSTNSEGEYIIPVVCDGINGEYEILIPPVDYCEVPANATELESMFFDFFLENTTYSNTLSGDPTRFEYLNVEVVPGQTHYYTQTEMVTFLENLRTETINGQTGIITYELLWDSWRQVTSSFEALYNVSNENDILRSPNFIEIFLQNVESKVTSLAIDGGTAAEDALSFHLPKNEIYLDDTGFDASIAYKSFYFDQTNDIHIECFSQYDTDVSPCANASEVLGCVTADEDRYLLYQCINNYDATAEDPSEQDVLEEMETSCLTGCNQRESSFREGLIQNLHAMGWYIEGDAFEIVYIADLDSYELIGDPRDPNVYDFAQCEIDHMVYSLVEHCKTYCSFTPQYNNEGVLVSFATEEELANLKNVLLADFNIDLSEVAPSGYEDVDVPQDNGVGLFDLKSSSPFTPKSDKKLLTIRNADGYELDQPISTQFTSTGEFYVTIATEESEIEIEDQLGNVIITTEDPSNNIEKYSKIIIKFDATGNYLWHYIYGVEWFGLRPVDEQYETSQPIPDPDYDVGNVLDSQPFEVIVDASGDLAFRFLVADCEGYVDRTLTNGGNSRIVPAVTDNNCGYGTFIVGKISSDGTLLWDRLEEINYDNIGLGNINEIGHLKFMANGNVVASKVEETFDSQAGTYEYTAYTSIYQDGAGNSVTVTDSDPVVSNKPLATRYTSDANNNVYMIVTPQESNGDITINSIQESFTDIKGFLISFDNTGAYKWDKEIVYGGTPYAPNIYGGFNDRIFLQNSSLQNLENYNVLSTSGYIEIAFDGSIVGEMPQGHKFLQVMPGEELFMFYSGVNVEGKSHTYITSGGRDYPIYTILPNWQRTTYSQIVRDSFWKILGSEDVVGPNPTKELYLIEMGQDHLSGIEACYEGSLNFTWGDIPNDDGLGDPESTDFVDIVFGEYSSCDEAGTSAVLESINSQKSSIIAATETKLWENYKNACGTINNKLFYNINIGTEHFTLYYYDRSGNLERTVPPEGVKETADVSTSALITEAKDEQGGNKPTIKLETKYEYNSLGQLVWQSTPDAGETNFIYDTSLGLLRFAQNEKQLDEGNFSYTKYDYLGRVIEVGQASYDQNTYTSWTELESFFKTEQSYNSDFPTSGTEMITRTFYSDDISAGWMPTQKDELGQDQFVEQRYLRNRVSYSVYMPDGEGDEDKYSYTVYSYDPHGNVEWLVQKVPGMATGILIEYEYDLISGNVLLVKYNEGFSDQFYHKYQYDSDNRLLGVFTSRDKEIWEEDANYSYYDHGPLKRTEMGQDYIQGLDYTYTIHGWLKGINQANLEGAQDPGNDGVSTARDAFGMALGYYNGDYVVDNNPFSSIANPVDNLYNGNIATWTSDTDNSSFTASDAITKHYRYDKLNRIKQSSLVGGFDDNAYRTAYSYDGNGNLESLLRYDANDVASSQVIDQLEYIYESDIIPEGSDNKLITVKDAANSSKGFSSTEEHYIYDAIGNLTEHIYGPKSNPNETRTITWNVYGKVASVVGDNITTTFDYDAAGNRVGKHLTTNSNGATTNTYYIRDASGNTMAVYEQTSSDPLYLREQTIYGVGRLGIHKTNKEVVSSTINVPENTSIITSDYKVSAYEDKSYWIQEGGSVELLPGFEYEAISSTDEFRAEYNNVLSEIGVPTEDANYFSRWSGYKQFELKDHLGNLRAVVADQIVLNEETSLLYDQSFEGQPDGSFMGSFDGWSVAGLDLSRAFYSEQWQSTFNVDQIELAKAFNVFENYKTYRFSVVTTFQENMSSIALEVRWDDEVRRISSLESGELSLVFEADSRIEQSTVNVVVIAESTGNSESASFLLDDIQIEEITSVELLANLVSSSDYYPYGLDMPGRSDASGYRYGFNGKEKDLNGEWGSGVNYDFGERIYNPAIGRWFITDPLEYMLPGISPYNYAGNNPIWYIDSEGEVMVIPIVLWLGKGYATGFIAGLGDGILDELTSLYDVTIGGSIIGHALSYKYYPAYKERTDAQIQLLDMIPKILEDDELRSKAIESVKKALGDSFKDAVGVNGSAKAGYAHGKLFVAAVTAVVGTKGVGTIFKATGELSEDAFGAIRKNAGEILAGICFVEGTEVLAPTGLLSIESISVGDTVYSYNEITDIIESNIVAKVFKRNTSEIYTLVFEGQEIKTTSEHPFYTTNGWRKASLLNEGDSIKTVDGFVTLSLIQKIDTSQIFVYNFEVESNHNYFVSSLGILVHNNCAELLSSTIKWKGFSKGKLASHFDKHVIKQAEFGDITQADYLKKAKEFAAEKGDHIQEKVISNIVVKYDSKTGRVLVGNSKNREIRTFYKDDGRSETPFQDAIDLAIENTSGN